MYAQCYVNGNEYLLLESFFDHKNDDSPLTVDDQKVRDKIREASRKSAAGWEISCKQKNGSTLWKK